MECNEVGGNEGSSKTSLTPLWRCVTKLEGVKCLKPLNFYEGMIINQGNLALVHVCTCVHGLLVKYWREMIMVGAIWI